MLLPIIFFPDQLLFLNHAQSNILSPDNSQASPPLPTHFVMEHIHLKNTAQDGEILPFSFS